MVLGFFLEFAFQVGSVCAAGFQTYLYLCLFTSSPDCWGAGENCGLFLFMLCLTWQPVLVPPAEQRCQGAAGLSTTAHTGCSSLARRQHSLLGPSTLSPCGGTECSSCSSSASAAFQGILREKSYKEKKSELFQMTCCL